MSDSVPPATRARSAEEINAEIRALWPHAAVGLSDEQRDRYERLIVEWARAVRTEVVTAA